MSGTADYDLTLTGLSCASCVRRAETALSAVPGVSSASVNLATARAKVVAEPGLAQDLVAAAKKAGYPAEVAETRLDISDMSCASCVSRVEKALIAVPGVVSAQVNLATSSANVSHLGGANVAEAAAAASTKLGYPAKVVSADGPQTDDNRHEAEAAALARKTWIAAILTLPVFLLEMGGHLFPAWHHLIGRTIGHETSWLIQFALTTAVLAGPGRSFYTHGLRTLAQRAPDMNALVAVGTGAAYLFSLVALFLPGLLPEGTRAVYFEAAAVIVTLILVGRMLEARAKGRTGAAIRKLLALSPDTAEVWRDGAFREIPATNLQAGERVRIRPGARVPADGEVIDGFSYVDESMITGEPLAVQKSPGSPVTGGTVNGTGALEITTTTVGADSTLSRIVAMVQDAQSAKLPVQAMVDRVTAWFVPAVMTAAVLTVAIWLIFGGLSVLSLALVAGVSVLIIACPCAMGLATPTSIMVGTGRAAEMGVLFRKGDALQRLSEIATVAFDKTGTVTEGRPAVTDITVAEGLSEDDVLALAAAAEARSEHPLARAIVAGAEKRGLALAEVTEFGSTTGQGIEARVDGRTLRIGNARFAEPTPRLQAAADRFAEDGKTAVFVTVDGTPAGVIAISDPIKSGAAETIAALHAAGLKVAMISGDAPATANAIGTRLGIDTVIAGVLPDGKVAALRDLAQAGPLAFVGDGINDAPALAAADVGIAMGTGTDIAIESADVVLMSGRPEGVRNAVKISTATVRNIRQNLFWAFAYNTLLIPVAAGLLYIFGGPLLSPMLAAGAMALSSVFVVSNALRLRRVAPATDGGAGGGDRDRARQVTASKPRESLA